MTKLIGAPTLDDAILRLEAEVAEDGKRGMRTLVFCEDRLTLLAERAVLAATGGTFRAEVTTFKRFLRGGATLSKEGSVMAMETILAANRKELCCFRAGSARAVYETIAQLTASRVDAAALRAGAAETEGSLRAKLGDLALLLEKYEEFLSSRGLVDENGYLALLPAAIESGGLRETHVVFFAFPSFTRRALEGVAAAIRSAESVTGIFVAGRESFYTNESASAFRRAAEEYGGTVREFAESSLPAEAELLRRRLFSPEQLTGKRESACVRLFSAADETEEMEKIAALVKRYVCGGYRYRDLAVLVPDGSYFSAAAQVFPSYGIPFFADRKRPFSEHPFCAFALAVLSAVHDNALPAEADDIASSVYFGEGDRYRNYLLKYGGYRGAVQREIKEGSAAEKYGRAELVACRARMLKFLSVFPKKGTGSTFAAGVRTLYELADGDAVTEKLLAGAEGAEREFLSVSPLGEVLAEIEAVAGERVFTAREFAAVLGSGAEAREISMIPQYADALFVGDATESRIYRSRVLFCAGLTEDLPRAAKDTAVVTDGEIARLGQLRVNIEPAIAQVNARAREMFALNLCAFTEALYLSCPDRKGGAETARSEVFYYVEKTFSPAPMPEVSPYDCSSRGAAELRALELRGDFTEGRTDDTVRCSSILAALDGRGEGERLHRLFAGEEREKVPSAAALWFRGDASPTLLESYFECPYAGFAMRGLRLEEREERPVLDTDAGTFVHTVLEEVAKEFSRISSEEECRAAAKGRAEELLKTPRFSSLADTKAGEYTAERLVGECAAVSAAAYRQLAGSAFRVENAEGKLSLPELSLSGKADRVDVAGEYVRVIDYKTGSIDDKPVSYYTGRKLQLQLYLLAAAREGKPAGAFYFPAAQEFLAEGEEPFRMKGFYCGDGEVVSLFDISLREGEGSAFFEGGLGGRKRDKGMSAGDFSDFLSYASLVSAEAEKEMKEGVVLPAPYEGACARCKLGGMCGFVGTERKERAIGCAEIAEIARGEEKK